MPFWRREEPLHERLAREGGLTPRDGGPLDPRSQLEVGIHGIARARQWDAVVAVATAGPPLDRVEFVSLADGTLLVDDDLPEGSLSALAEAVETELQPPYRAEAVRRGDEVWAVAATRIEVVELEEDPGGDEIELASRDGHRTLLVDGASVFGSIPRLEELGGARHEAYVVRAERLDGSLWEVVVSAL